MERHSQRISKRSKKLTLWLTLTLLLLVVVAFWTYLRSMSPRPGPGDAGRQEGRAPAAAPPGTMYLQRFTLPSVWGGNAIDSNDFAGNVLLITFFASWCQPCRAEVPTLNRLQKEFGDQGFSVLGLNVEMVPPREIGEKLADWDISYPVAVADDTVMEQFGGINAVPTNFMVDRQGRIVTRYLGYVDHSILERDVQKLVATW